MMSVCVMFFFFKQKTAYEVRISDWSSDVCSSDLVDHRLSNAGGGRIEDAVGRRDAHGHGVDQDVAVVGGIEVHLAANGRHADAVAVAADAGDHAGDEMARLRVVGRSKTERVEVRHRPRAHGEHVAQDAADRSEEHTSELQSLMRISYAVFCLKKKKLK